MILQNLNLLREDFEISAKCLELILFCDKLEQKRSALPLSEVPRLPELCIKFPSEKFLDFILLDFVKEILPLQIRLKVEERVSKLQLDLNFLRKRIKVYDRVELDNDLNYLNGRLKRRLLFLLNQMRIFLVFPRKPEQGQRIRGFRDKGCLISSDARAKREQAQFFDTKAAIRRILQREKLKDDEDASQILVLERAGRQEELAGFVAATSAGRNIYFREILGCEPLPPTTTLISLAVWNLLIEKKVETFFSEEEILRTKDQKLLLKELEQRAVEYLEED